MFCKKRFAIVPDSRQVPRIVSRTWSSSPPMDARSPPSRWWSTTRPVRPLFVRFDGGRVQRLPHTWPYGFDARGRLIGLRRWLVAIDPATGRASRLADHDESAVVTPLGRWIVLHPVERRGKDGFTVIRVRDDRQRTFPLVRGSWTLSPELTTDRSAVLQELRQQSLFAVFDLPEEWIGYVRFEPRP